MEREIEAVKKEYEEKVKKKKEKKKKKEEEDEGGGKSSKDKDKGKSDEKKGTEEDDKATVAAATKEKDEKVRFTFLPAPAHPPDKDHICKISRLFIDFGPRLQQRSKHSPPLINQPPPPHQHQQPTTKFLEYTHCKSNYYLPTYLPACLRSPSHEILRMHIRMTSYSHMSLLYDICNTQIHHQIISTHALKIFPPPPSLLFSKKNKQNLLNSDL